MASNDSNNPDNLNILDDIDVTTSIYPSNIVVVGRSGSGKTRTIQDLLYRFASDELTLTIACDQHHCYNGYYDMYRFYKKVVMMNDPIDAYYYAKNTQSAKCGIRMILVIDFPQIENDVFRRIITKTNRHNIVSILSCQSYNILHASIRINIDYTFITSGYANDNISFAECTAIYCMFQKNYTDFIRLITMLKAIPQYTSIVIMKHDDRILHFNIKPAPGPLCKDTMDKMCIEIEYAPPMAFGKKIPQGGVAYQKQIYEIEQMIG